MLFRPMLGSAMSGKLGGNVWSHNSGGTYARVRNAVTNPNTGLQNIPRNALALASQVWSLTLSQAERDSWAAYAAQVTVRNRIGDSINLAGNAQFNRSNAVRIQAGLPVVTQAPSNFDIGTLTLPDLTNRVDGSSPTIDVTFNPLDTWHDGTIGGALLVFVSPAKSATINFYRGPYNLAAVIPGDAVGPQTIPLRGTLNANQRVFFRYIATTSDGRLSQELFASNPGAGAPAFGTNVQLLSAVSDAAATSTVLLTFSVPGVDGGGTFNIANFTTDGPGNVTAATGPTTSTISLVFDNYVANGEVLTINAGAFDVLAGYTLITPQSVVVSAPDIPLTVANGTTDGLLNSQVTLTFNEPGLDVGTSIVAADWDTDTPATASMATINSPTDAIAIFGLATVAVGDQLTVQAAGLALRPGFTLTFPVVTILI